MTGLIETARLLVSARPGGPSQADLRRALSTAYFAVFDALAALCADQVTGGGGARARPAWTKIHRSLDHGAARRAFQTPELRLRDGPVRQLAGTFTRLQELRHAADYDPHAPETTSEDVSAVIQVADEALGLVAELTGEDVEALVVALLFRARP